MNWRSARQFGKPAISVIALGALLLWADSSEILDRVSTLSLGVWAVAVGFATGQVLLTASRWWLFLANRTTGRSFFAVLEIHLLGLIAGSFLLGGLGSAIMRAALVHRLRIPLATGLASVLADKLAATAGLAVLLLATAPFALTMTGSATIWNAALWASASVAAAVVIMVPLVRTQLGREFRTDVARFLARIWSVLGEIARDRSTISRALGLTVVSQLFLFAATFAIANGMEIRVSFWQLLVIFPAVSFVASLPISVGGWGIREGAMVFALSLLGVGFESALTLSIVVGFTSLAAILPAALLCLINRHRPTAKHAQNASP